MGFEASQALAVLAYVTGLVGGVGLTAQPRRFVAELNFNLAGIFVFFYSFW